MSAPFEDKAITAESFDVIIAGGGIGGCVAALALHRHAPNAKVLLVEDGTYPRHKVCGEFFSPEGWAVLARLGLAGGLHTRGAAPVRHARVLTSHGQTGPIPLPAPAWAISRWQLDDLLWQQARQVCDARETVRVRRVNKVHCGYTVSTRDGALRAKFVIDAMGRNARHEVETCAPNGQSADKSSARYLGLKTHFLETHLPNGEVQLYPFRGGYCGLIRVEEGRANACLLARYDGFTKPDSLWQRALEENAALRKMMHNATPGMPWLATGNVTFGKMEPVCDGVLRCGDAAGYIQPFAGDGQAMAARSGELAAACIGAALRGGLRASDVSTLYAAAWKREFASRLHWGSWLQPLLLTPRAGDVAVKVLTRAPGLARLLALRTRGR